MRSSARFPGVLALVLCAGFGSGVCEVQADPVTRTLTVTTMPYSGMVVTLTPPDLNDESGAATEFTRQYPDGTVVTLTAPATVGANSFVKWKRDGVDFTTDASTDVTLNADRTMTAVYFTNNQGLANGSFESDFTGWTATGNQFIESGAPYVTTDGTKLVTFNGNRSDDFPPDAVLSQTFETTPGATYTLAFDIGVYATNTAEQRLEVTVEGTGNLLTQVAPISGAGGPTIQWSPLSYSFLADSADTTLTFRDISTTTNGIDVLLDNVRVTRGGPNAAPAAVNDAATIHSGQKVRLAVLANDIGVFDPGTLEIVSPPPTGTATVVSPGEILYAHTGVDTAPVSFTYRVTGDGGPSQPATVDVDISSALRIPNNTLNIPAEPPATEVKVVPAYPGVTLTQPLCFSSPPGDAERLFVCEFGGKLKVIPNVTDPNPTSSLVLDLAEVLTTPPRSPAESYPSPAWDAFTGLAFHPDYASNGYFYIAYAAVKSTDPDVVYQRLSRFTVPPAQLSQPAPVADPSSELILIEQRDRLNDHSGSDLHFGADGYLYWVIGDEGSGIPADPKNNSQHIDVNFFSAMLRIDVDKKPGNLEPNAHPNPAAAGSGYSSVNAIPRDEVPAGSGNFVARYSIPIDNPFVPTSQGGAWDGTFNGSAITAGNLPYVRSEFWAVGLRSPWRFSIDKPTGEIWLGDVGENTYEEVNLITKGGNYGWVFREGLHDGPKTPNPGLALTDPIYEYAHESEPGDPTFKGNSVIGGVVYRGSRFASLTGAYIFGDYVSGHIWALTRPGGVTTVRRIAGQPMLTTFGTDPSNGDVLVSDFAGGRIMRIVTTTTTSDFPATLSATRLFADLTDLSPAPGVLPYTPNLKFWSDHAVKSRWFCIPDATSRMTWSRDGSWTYPSGQFWVKHFDLETERGNPASPKKRIETRLLVKNDSGVYGVSYRWNEAGTEAHLAPDGGEDFPVNITVDSSPYSQLWSIPSRSQCITCHSPEAGYSLSFNTRQLNRDNTLNGFSGNQLDLLCSQGCFSNTPPSSNVLPRHVRPDETAYSLEARVRSYLAVNCAYCHAGSSGTAPPAWDGRHHLTLDETGLINGNTSVAGGAYKLIVPGDSAHSVALQRMGATGGFTRMPPLGSHEIDTTNLALITDWINQSLPNRVTYGQWRLATFGSPDSPQGDPAADPDGDGVSNRDEFLAGTLALSGGSFLHPDVSLSGPDALLSFSIPDNRSVQVESSQNLADWALWNIPGNGGDALPGGTVLFSGPASDPSQFFRIRVSER